MCGETEQESLAAVNPMASLAVAYARWLSEEPQASNHKRGLTEWALRGARAGREAVVAGKEEEK